MKGSSFTFEHIDLLEYHLHKISLNRGSSYIESPFINNYNWKGIEFPSHSKDWRKFECNNKAIALNILYVPYNKEQIRQAYISKHNDKRDKQVILLMIADEVSNWHYLTVKSMSGLLRGIASIIMEIFIV